MNDHKGRLGVVARRLPSIFDIYVIALVLCMAYWRSGYEKSLIYNLGVLGLWGLCLTMKPKRIYYSLPLGLLLMWSLTNIFFHAWRLDLLKGIASKYLNICLLSESFIYIFSSIVLFKLIITYAKRWEYYIPAIAIALAPLARRLYHQGSMTLILSIGVAVIIYGFINRKWKLSSLALLLGLNVVAWNWKWVAMKFYVRPLVWRQLWDEFIQHPWIGQGYWRGLSFDYADQIWVKYDNNYGPAFRHNDYLNFGVYIGTAAIVLVTWFMIREIVRMRHSPACMVFMTLAIIPFFQMTFLELYKATLMVTGMATAVVASGVYENTYIGCSSD